VKAVLVGVISVALLRFGFVAGWRDAGRHLALAGQPDAPRRVQAPARKAHRSAADLVEYFRERGLPCTAKPGPRLFAPGKATELLEVEGDGWHAAVYEFDKDKDAEELARMEKTGREPVYRNHNVVLRVIEGKDKVLPVFKQF
jgi:hypothetical protein